MRSLQRFSFDSFLMVVTYLQSLDEEKKWLEEKANEQLEMAKILDEVCPCKFPV